MKAIMISSEQRTKEDIIEEIIENLEELINNKEYFIKIYFEDKDNYTIKIIDMTTKKKIFGKRKCNHENKMSFVDNEYMKKGNKNE